MLLKSDFQLMCQNQSGDLLNCRYNLVWNDVLIATPIHFAVETVVDIAVDAVIDTYFI